MIQTIVTDLLLLVLVSKNPAVSGEPAGSVVIAIPAPRPGEEVPVTEYQPLDEEKMEVEQPVYSYSPILTNTVIQQAIINRPAPAEVEATIDRYAGEYGVDAGKMKTIASCESGYNPGSNSGPYGGMYQFLAGTWVSNRTAMGLDPDPALRFNAEESIKTAAFKMSRDGYGAWPVCSRI